MTVRKQQGSTPESFVSILKAMRELLLKHDYLEHADHAPQLIDDLNLRGSETRRIMLH